MLMLVGCATVTFSACGMNTPFAPAFLVKVADELAALPRDSALRVVVDDWIKMRDAVKACRSTR